MVSLTLVWLLFAVAVVALAIVAVLLWRSFRTPSEPADDPIAAPNVSPARFVRLSDYEADSAAISRRISEVEVAQDRQYKELTGMVAQSRQLSRKSAREEERAALLEQVRDELAARKEPASGPELVAPTRIIRRGS